MNTHINRIRTIINIGATPPLTLPNFMSGIKTIAHNNPIIAKKNPNIFIVGLGSTIRVWLGIIFLLVFIQIYVSSPKHAPIEPTPSSCREKIHLKLVTRPKAFLFISPADLARLSLPRVRGCEWIQPLSGRTEWESGWTTPWAGKREEMIHVQKDMLVFS